MNVHSCAVNQQSSNSQVFPTGWAVRLSLYNIALATFNAPLTRIGLLQNETSKLIDSHSQLDTKSPCSIYYPDSFTAHMTQFVNRSECIRVQSQEKVLDQPAGGHTLSSLSIWCTEGGLFQIEELSCCYSMLQCKQQGIPVPLLRKSRYFQFRCAK